MNGTESRRIVKVREDGTKVVIVLPPGGHGNVWIGGRK